MPREWAFRRGRPSDVPFIVDTWLKSLANTLRRAEKGSAYRQAQQLVIASVLEDSVVYVATGVDEPDLLLGFLCAEPQSSIHRLLLHYVYVVKAWRGMGVARSLMRHFIERELPEVGRAPQMGGITVTELTMPWHYHYLKRRGWGMSTRRTYYHALAKEMQRMKETA